MLAFVVGALLPVATILLAPADVRVVLTPVAVALALAGTGYLSSRIGEARPRPAVIRNVCGGLLAMGVTYLIGAAVGTGMA
jgi:VIT1/CCC1 family predicted Fe2+/Mn2+ transporter